MSNAYRRRKRRVFLLIFFIFPREQTTRSVFLRGFIITRTLWDTYTNAIYDIYVCYIRYYVRTRDGGISEFHGKSTRSCTRHAVRIRPRRIVIRRAGRAHDRRAGMRRYTCEGTRRGRGSEGFVKRPPSPPRPYCGRINATASRSRSSSS